MLSDFKVVESVYASPHVEPDVPAFPKGRILPGTQLQVLHLGTGELPRLPAFEIDSRTWLLPYVLDTTDDYDDGAAFVCTQPFPSDSLLGWESDMTGETWLEDECAISFALENGICPGQEFYLLVSVDTQGYREGTEYFWTIEVVWKEQCSESEAAAAWMELLQENARWRAVDRDHRDAWEARVDASPKYLRVMANHYNVRIGTRTTASKPCECHHFPHRDTVCTTRDIGDWSQWVCDRIAEHGWEDLPIHLPRKDSASFLRPFMELFGVSTRVVLADEHPNRDIAILPPLSAMRSELIKADSVYRLTEDDEE